MDPDKIVYINECLKTLRTIHRLTDQMMEDDCHPDFIKDLFECAGQVACRVDPDEVFELYPELVKDPNFCEFMENVNSHLAEKHKECCGANHTTTA